MKKDNNKNNNMSEEELDALAEKIATKVATKLVDLNDISDYFRGTSYTFKPFMEQYKPKLYEEPESNQEEELIGELSKLMTMMNLYESKEEYEKCAKIKKKIDAINRKIQRAGSKRGVVHQGYIEEYGEITSTKAKNKKEYKAEQKAKMKKIEKNLPKELP